MSKNVYTQNTYTSLQRNMTKNIYCSAFLKFKYVKQAFRIGLIKVWYSHSNISQEWDRFKDEEKFSYIMLSRKAWFKKAWKSRQNSASNLILILKTNANVSIMQRTKSRDIINKSLNSHCKERITDSFWLQQLYISGLFELFTSTYSLLISEENDVLFK